MAKIKLEADPTFKASVPVPIPGAGSQPVEFTFKWRTRSDVVKWMDAMKDKADAEVIFDTATAWELDDAFTLENVQKLCDVYAGAGCAFVETYLNELRGARTKN